jgi:hypothetical protein
LACDTCINVILYECPNAKDVEIYVKLLKCLLYPLMADGMGQYKHL